jgi:hypothetical protein
MDLDSLAVTETLIDGRVCWLFADGTVLPVIQGGADGGDGDGGDGSGGEGDGDGEGSGTGEGAGGTGSGTSTDGDSDSGDGKGDVKVQMTQAELDALIGKAHGKAKTQAEREFKQWLERQQMDDAARAKAEKDDAEKAAQEHVKGANGRLVRAEAKVAALAAGVKADRVTRFLRNVDLDDVEVDDDGDVDEKAVAKAVKAALDEVPEFKGGASNGGGGGSSGGEFNGTGDKKVWTRDEISKLSPEEYEKHEEEILAQLAKGGIK